MRPNLHPACAAFPPLPDADLKELAEDIRKNGLLEPITLFDGQLLDGRCRWDACELAGIEPRTAEFDGDDPIAFVLSKNANRRHLTASQKAMALARLANLRHGSNQFRRTPFQKGSSFPITINEIAKRGGVGHTSIEFGRALLRIAEPNIIKMVDEGLVTVQVATAAARTHTRTSQAEWTSGDVFREGRKIIDAYPSNQRGVSTSKKPKKSKTKKGGSSPARREYGFHQFPTKEEIDGPPDDAPYEEHAAFTRKYGKVMLHPRAVKDLMNCQAMTDGFAVAVMAAANPTHPEAEAFFEALDQMLAHVPDRTKKNGMERDFAKFARTALGLLETKLPVLLAKLVAYQAALEARRSPTESQTTLAGALETTSTAAA